MVIGLLGLQGHPGHEAESGIEIGEDKGLDDGIAARRRLPARQGLQGSRAGGAFQFDDCHAILLAPRHDAAIAWRGS